MSWLFKDPINSGLAHSDHAQSNGKKWPQNLKDQIAPNEFFSRKTTNKIFMYLLAPFILQNFQKILRTDPELWGCAIFGPKMAHLSWTKKFWYKSLLLLLSTSGPLSFTVQSLKKFLQQIQSYKDVPFLAQNGPNKTNFCPKQKAFLGDYYYHSHLPISPFHCVKFKKNFFQRIQSAIFGPKMAHFFQKTC